MNEFQTCKLSKLQAIAMATDTCMLHKPGDDLRSMQSAMTKVEHWNPYVLHGSWSGTYINVSLAMQCRHCCESWSKCQEIQQHCEEADPL